ncbi:hypothetical protein CK203_007407 [Vitis vinifera]|uniref:Uncharacterized protein n=1 Tax=Vitis vinifera TaxID=29760 RepID=A0A438G1R9_VITVI|nr:hypothetical protein CK203_007407 [Vitis vinifera]
MLRWAIELSESGIKYQSKLALKGQVMTDFVVELPKSHPTKRTPLRKDGGYSMWM